MTTRHITRKALRSQKINLSRSTYIPWMVIGLLVFMGGNMITNQMRVFRLQTEPLVVYVADVSQSLGTFCGVDVIAMVYHYAYPVTPISGAQVIGYATAQGYFTEGIPPYTSPVNMVKIARNYTTSVSSGVVA